MKVSFTQKITLMLMTAALGLVFIYAAGMIGYVGYALLVFASVVMYILTTERWYGFAVFAFLLTSAIAFFIVPNKVCFAVYACLIGHYAIARSLIDEWFTDKIIKLCLKLLYCNIWLIVGFCLLIFALHMQIPTKLPIPMGVITVGAQVALIAFEALHMLLRKLYIEIIRDNILPRR